MGTGGRPGITFKASIILEENNGRIIMFPSIQDKDAVFSYLKEYQTGEFVSHLTPVAAQRGGDSGSGPNEEST